MKERIPQIIDLIYREVISACGDGDALWYSKYYSVEEILPYIEAYNKNLRFPWTIEVKDKTISWGDYQE